MTTEFAFAPATESRIVNIQRSLLKCRGSLRIANGSIEFCSGQRQGDHEGNKLRPRAHSREPLICHNLFRRFKWARPAYYETKPTCRRGWQRRRLPEQESPRLAVSAASVPTDSGRGTVGSQWPSHSAQTCWPGR